MFFAENINTLACVLWVDANLHSCLLRIQTKPEKDRNNLQLFYDDKRFVGLRDQTGLDSV